MSNEEAKNLVDVLADLISVGDKVIEDKGGLISRLLDLQPLVGDAGTLSGTDFKAALQQFESLDAAGKTELLAEFGSRLKLTSAPVASDIVEGIALAVELESFAVQYVAKVKALVEKIKAPAAPSA